jgi:hypothetical protein
MGAGIASLAGVNIQPVSTWIILAFVLVPLVYGFVTASGARKSDAD